MEFDFIVIGGGIAGTSAGAQLAQLGTVCLLEAEPALAYHASGRSAALYEAQYGLPSTTALNRASKEAHETLDGGLLSPRGLMLLATAGEEEAFTLDCANMHLDPLSPSDAQAMVPILDVKHVHKAAYHSEAWDIDTDRMVQTYARQIRANGEVRTSTKVQKITRTAHGWSVDANDEALRANTLVNAAGAWADEIAIMAGIPPIGLTPLRRSMARMPAPGGHGVSDWPMLFGVGESWYAKPDAGAWLVSPAEEDAATPHDAFADDMVLAEGIARYQPFVTQEVTRMTSSWAGLRTFAPDRNLVIGPDPTESAFIWNAGQGGYGFQTAPAASTLLADLVAGRQSVLDRGTIAALSPSRFR